MNIAGRILTEEAQLTPGKWYAIGIAGLDGQIDWGGAPLLKYQGEELLVRRGWRGRVRLGSGDPGPLRGRVGRRLRRAVVTASATSGLDFSVRLPLPFTCGAYSGRKKLEIPMATAPLPKLGSLVVRVDRVYGNLVTYPVCERAKLIAEIAGSKTLTHATLCYAERLGFEIVPVDALAKELAARG